MYLVDTDVLIWVLRGDEKYKELLQTIKKQGSLCISTITIAEIYKNIYPSEMVKTEEILNEFQTYNVSEPIAKQAGLYWQQYSKKLRNLSLTDCMIAATANIHNLIFLSLNTKHFPMKDIKLFHPGK